ncbi:MAG: chromosome segregation protein SMC, partial [Candidatus Altiarchaeales archaeon]|nr:chromosome segregation protein SMC [Candidatus Altiarchaeales archaeon]
YLWNYQTIKRKMRLAKIELKGFKSFRDKTTLVFPHQFTGIVGPNGSGKSNITEAVCFVFGQSRGLRAANIQELIFNGGVHQSPAKKAVVSITLEEDSGRRHKLTRIVDREGKSTYKIGDQRATRQQIIDLVGDNEYNIILQDDVTKVIDMRPQQRRVIIDNLCGIAEYDAKKEKALRELDKVEERISQTHIILGEKQGYLKELSRERKEALDYQSARTNLRRCRATLLHKEIQSLAKRDEKLTESKSALEGEKENLRQGIHDADQIIRGKTDQIKQANEKIKKLQQERGDSKIAQLHGELLRRQDRNQYLQDELKKLSQRTQKINAENEQISLETKKIEAVVAEKNALIESKNRELKPLLAAQGDTKILDEINTLRYELSEKKATQQSLKESLSEKKARYDDLVERQKDCSRQNTQLQKEGLKLRNQLVESEKANKKVLDEFKASEEKYNLLQTRLSDAQKRLEEKKIAHESRKTEIETIKNASGGLREAVAAILNLKKVLPGIHGPIYQLGTVTKKEYELPLEVAAGGRMQYIVVEDVDVAAKCIKYLRDKKTGRATFLPLDKINPKAGGGNHGEAIGLACDYIDCKPKFRRVFDFIYRDTLIVDDISCAKKIGIGSRRMVTLEGDLIESTGVMSGGHVKKQSFGFHDLSQLEAQLQKLSEEKTSLHKLLEELESEKDTRFRQLRENRNRVSENHQTLDQLRLEKQIQAERQTNLDSQIKSFDRQLNDLETQRTHDKNRVHQLAADIKRLEGELKPLLAQQKTDRDDSHVELQNQVRNLEVECARESERKLHLSARLRENQSLLAETKQQETQLTQRLGEGEELESELQKKLERLRSESQNLYVEVEKIERQKQELEDQLAEDSQKTGETQHRIGAIDSELSSINIEQAKIETRLEDLNREYNKYDEVELLEDSIKNLQQKAEELESSLEEYGSVNLKAIDTYDIVKKEYDDTMEKLEVLKQERSSIYDFMAKIEEKKTKTFMEAFNKVKENFERIFADLSEGRGTLTLDNPGNISDSGLGIKASPKAKKIMSLDAMSGGEKTLTSAAFLLAIQQYKPSHFYIVDELDAALDKTNSSRLAKMLADSGTQFLMVTHNNQMMRYMQSAIGVTMVDGVSQIVGVEMA